MVDPGHPVSVVMLKVPGDGLGSGVQASIGQILADPTDQVDHLGCEGAAGGLGAPGAGFSAVAPSAS